VVNPRRVVGRQAERDGGQRGDRPGQPDQGARALCRYRLCDGRERGVDVLNRGGGLVPPWRIVVQVPFGKPDAADVDRESRQAVLAVSVGLAEDEFGRSAADVHDEEWRLRPSG
jgi:hypothetical protein